jgi:hypothetical protein
VTAYESPAIESRDRIEDPLVAFGSAILESATFRGP